MFPAMLGLFLVSVGVVIYTYAVYPLIVVVMGLCRPKIVRRDDNHVPSITLIISAYNEERVIEEKLRNALALDYPSDRLEIVVASESTDSTNAVVATYADRGIRLRAFSGRTGKSSTLFRVMPSICGDIVVFSDANAMYRPDALRKLVRNFADPAVGCVIGQLLYRESSGSLGGRGETVYWRYDRWVRRQASHAKGVVPGINGSIFAIRRCLYFPVSEERGDDYELCTRIGIKGYEVAAEPEAVAEERASETTQQQFQRKVRLVRWNTFSSLILIREALTCGNVLIAFQVFSHRFLRYTVPIWLMLMLGSSALLAPVSSIFAVLFAAQLAFYGVGAMGWIADVAQYELPAFCLIPSYFVMVNSAAILAIISLSRGQVTIWQKQR